MASWPIRISRKSDPWSSFIFLTLLIPYFFTSKKPKYYFYKISYRGFFSSGKPIFFWKFEINLLADKMRFRLLSDWIESTVNKSITIVFNFYTTNIQIVHVVFNSKYFQLIRAPIHYDGRVLKKMFFLFFLKQRVFNPGIIMDLNR